MSSGLGNEFSDMLLYYREQNYGAAITEAVGRKNPRVPRPFV